MMEHRSHSNQLRDKNLALWNEMQAHAFVEDIKNDALARNVFHKYLQYEHVFVETAITIFGYALVKAPDLARKRWLAGVLDALSTEQIPYFETVFDALDVRPVSDHNTLPARVVAFNSGMLEIAANGSYHDVVVAMLCAEWMYAEWCQAAARNRISDPNVRAWVLLHTDTAFLNQAAWLKNEIDTLSPAEFDFERANEVFLKALSLEIDFHSAAYE
jgi:thiaminase/transcriptional activator TenA